MDLPGSILKKSVPCLVLLATLLISPLMTYGSVKSKNNVKIAMLPIIDSFPYYIAETTGEFEKVGIKVTLIPVMSALNRDQLMQAGEVDGMLNEMTSAANFNRKVVQVQVVYTIRSAQPSYPMFRLIASPRSGIKNIPDLKNASIGISRHTIIEYITDRLLEASHLDPRQTSKKSVPSIPERFQLLMQGQIQSAVLPDPLASAALAAGATLIIDDTSYPRYSASLFTFSMNTIQNRPDTLKRFFIAWDRAVKRLNNDPESFRGLLLKKIRVPKNVEKSYPIPLFSRNAVPNRQQWEDVMQWMVSKGLLKKPLSYKSSVSTTFLPGQQ